MLFRIVNLALCLLTPTVAWAGDSTIRGLSTDHEVDSSAHHAVFTPDTDPGVDHSEYPNHTGDVDAHHTPHLAISLYTADASSYQTNRDGTACFLVPAAATLSSCRCFSGDAGESLNLLEKSAGSDAGSQMLTTGTCDNSGADDSLTITDASIAAGSLVCLDVEGTPSAVFAWLGCEATYD